MKEQALMLLKGAGDIHVHTSPSLIPGRKSDIWTLIKSCEEKSMKFATVKWHHGDSYSAVSVVNQLHQGSFQLLGGLVLNETVGGLNPYAVDCAVALGAKIVWLPTLDAEGHGQAIGQLGGFPFQQVRRNRVPKTGIKIVDGNGKLVEEIKEILSLLNGKKTVLATGHISKQEIFSLHDYLQRQQLEINLLINHIDFSVPSLTFADISALTNPKTWFELAYFTLSKLGHSKIKTVKNLINKNPISPDAMLLFIQLLLENGLSENQLHNMLHCDTQKLLML